MYVVDKIKCPSCNKDIISNDFDNNFGVCPYCNFYLRLSAKNRINYFLDSWKEDIPYRQVITDPLSFEDRVAYSKKIKSLKKELDINESIIIGTAEIKDKTFLCGIFDFNFLGGTLGIETGEKIYSLFNVAVEKKLPVVLFITSGGARMQEGLFSLMQMQKVTVGISKIKKAKIPYITVLSSPTTGGVMATIASQGDIILAEQGADIGFTGKRVIKKLFNIKIPDKFQKAEQVQKDGFIDIVINRKELKQTLFDLLSYT